MQSVWKTAKGLAEKKERGKGTSQGKARDEEGVSGGAFVRAHLVAAMEMEKAKEMN